MVERSLLYHGIRIEDTQPADDVCGDDARLCSLGRRVSCIEKILRDNGLMMPDDSAGRYTFPSKVIMKI